MAMWGAVRRLLSLLGEKWHVSEWWQWGWREVIVSADCFGDDNGYSWYPTQMPFSWSGYPCPRGY